MSEPTPQPVFVARKTFVASIDGRRTTVRKDKTRVSADHELVSRYPDMFRQAADGLAFGVVTRDDKPEPTPEPEPESIDSKAVRAWAAENGIDVPKRGKIADAVVEAYTKAHAAPEPTPEPEPEPTAAAHEG